MPDVTVHDFRITDRVLADTEPDAADVVYLGAIGNVAAPFVIRRTLAGPGGVYIDGCSIVDADGTAIGTWERRFEMDGDSKPLTISTEVRGLSFPSPGTYMLEYSIYDDVIGAFPFTVAQSPAPSEGIVPGELDAALSKSTIAWIRTKDVHAPVGDKAAYEGGKDFPVWYGYDEGKVYVLVGEGEQQVPGLTDGDNVRLVARSKDKRSQVADCECEVDVLPKNAEWETIANDLLIGRRLNLKNPADALQRWKDTCEIVCLTPLPVPAGVGTSLTR